MSVGPNLDSPRKWTPISVSGSGARRSIPFHRDFDEFLKLMRAVVSTSLPRSCCLSRYRKLYLRNPDRLRNRKTSYSGGTSWEREHTSADSVRIERIDCTQQIELGERCSNPSLAERTKEQMLGPESGRAIDSRTKSNPEPDRGSCLFWIKQNPASGDAPYRQHHPLSGLDLGCRSPVCRMDESEHHRSTARRVQPRVQLATRTTT
jgi:hypothetical protein